VRSRVRPVDAATCAALEQHWKLQLEFPLGLEDEKRRPSVSHFGSRIVPFVITHTVVNYVPIVQKEAVKAD
jgi:hypothetical protein